MSAPWAVRERSRSPSPGPGHPKRAPHHPPPPHFRGGGAHQQHRNNNMPPPPQPRHHHGRGRRGEDEAWKQWKSRGNSRSRQVMSPVDKFTTDLFKQQMMGAPQFYQALAEAPRGISPPDLQPSYTAYKAEYRHRKCEGALKLWGETEWLKRMYCPLRHGERLEAWKSHVEVSFPSFKKSLEEGTFKWSRLVAAPHDHFLSKGSELAPLDQVLEAEASAMEAAMEAGARPVDDPTSMEGEKEGELTHCGGPVSPPPMEEEVIALSTTDTSDPITSNLPGGPHPAVVASERGLGVDWDALRDSHSAASLHPDTFSSESPLCLWLMSISPDADRHTIQRMLRYGAKYGSLQGHMTRVLGLPDKEPVVASEGSEAAEEPEDPSTPKISREEELASLPDVRMVEGPMYSPHNPMFFTDIFAVFESTEDAIRALCACHGAMVPCCDATKAQALLVKLVPPSSCKNRLAPFHSTNVLPAIFSDPVRITRDFRLARKMVVEMDVLAGLYEHPDEVQEKEQATAPPADIAEVQTAHVTAISTDAEPTAIVVEEEETASVVVESEGEKAAFCHSNPLIASFGEIPNITNSPIPMPSRSQPFIDPVAIQKVCDSLDQLIHYLRDVHLVDFYNGIHLATKESMAMFAPKPPLRHAYVKGLYRPSHHRQEPEILRRMQRRDEALGNIIRMLKGSGIPDKEEELSGKNDGVEITELPSYLDTLGSVTGTGKWRCLVGDCHRLFKDPRYLKNHIRNKHGEIFAELFGDWHKKEAGKVQLLNMLSDTTCDIGFETPEFTQARRRHPAEEGRIPRMQKPFPTMLPNAPATADSEEVRVVLRFPGLPTWLKASDLNLDYAALRARVAPIHRATMDLSEEKARARAKQHAIDEAFDEGNRGSGGVATSTSGSFSQPHVPMAGIRRRRLRSYADIQPTAGDNNYRQVNYDDVDDSDSDF